MKVRFAETGTKKLTRRIVERNLKVGELKSVPERCEKRHHAQSERIEIASLAVFLIKFLFLSETGLTL